MFALTVLDDSIYYTDWGTWNVKRANKYDGSDLTVLVESKQLDRRPRSIVGIGPEADNCTWAGVGTVCLFVCLFVVHGQV